MFKIYNKSIVLTLAILAISAFALATLPTATYAATGYNYTFTTYMPPAPTPEPPAATLTNPSPVITGISPSSSSKGLGTKTVTITGTGFIPTSIARMNGFDRKTVFIDSGHLLMKLAEGDLYRDDSFFITVWNKGPGGGYSNAAVFTIGKSAPSGGTVKKNTGYVSGAPVANTSDAPDTFFPVPASEDAQNISNLASNALFGSNSFLPSGLMQWIMFAIVLLLIVILVRKVFGAQEKYHATPLKHS